MGQQTYINAGGHREKAGTLILTGRCPDNKRKQTQNTKGCQQGHNYMKHL